MKRRKFYIGQAVVWSERGWIDVGHGVPAGLKRNQIYHVDGYWHKIVDGKRYLFLREIGRGKGYDERGFSPAELASDEALAQLLEESFASPVIAR